MGRWPASPVRPPPLAPPPPIVRAALELLPAAEPAARCAWAGIELKRTTAATAKNFFMIVYLACAGSVGDTAVCGNCDATAQGSTAEIHKDLELTFGRIQWGAVRSRNSGPLV